MMLLPMFCSLVLSLTSQQFGDFNPFTMQAEPLNVLQRREVQKELKLTKDQKQAIDAIVKQSYTSQGSPPNDMSQVAQGFNQYKEGSAKAMEVLDESQRARAKQIRYQMLGPVSISEPEVQKALGMTEAQIAQIAPIRQEANGQAMDAFQHPGMGRGLMGKIEGFSKAEAGKLLAILDDGQKAKLTDLYGPVFKKARPDNYFPM